MDNFFIKWLVNVVALLIVVKIIPGIKVDRWTTAILSALMLGLVNAFLRPLVILFTLPLNILSLGLFTLVINGFMFYLVSKLVPGFTVSSFWNAFWGALLFSIISFLLSLLISSQENTRMRFYKFHSPSKPEYRQIIDVEGEEKKEEERNVHRKT
ncbi:MAG TPA: hypothetical protein DHV62_08550 [Elusimicrobia bacterium]|jgi:putative membrane protein|nr:hypothetical protein [Elusimicrobiota bacterium]